MINTLSGTIVASPGPGGSFPTVTDGHITLEVGGIGYLVFVVARTDLRTIAGEKVPTRKFYIHEHIIAAQQGPSKYDLYGFETQEERKLFRALLQHCEGVGPLIALKIMNIAPPEQLLQAVRLGNTKYLERGTGPKIAQRIVLGLGKYAATEAAKTLV